MGQFINDISVKVDYDNALDKNFIFRTVTDGTEYDMVETVNKALQQKLVEGEISTQNLRSIEIKSNDERGFFATFAGNVKDLLKLV